MYPILTTKFEIANATQVTSKNGTDYVSVSFFDDRGYANNLWFPIEFLDFAKQNLHKVVTAEVRFFRGSQGRSANLSGVSLK